MSVDTPDIAVIETSGLGDRSYLVGSDGIAVVIDPQRDIDRVLDLARERRLRITHVLETHIHNDYVSGGLELSRATGAEYVVPAGKELGYARRAVHDGDVIEAGPMRLQAMHTPGHTHHHVSYVLRDDTGPVIGVFTGGSMLHGTTGRTDLLGAEHTAELSRAQFRSVRRLAAELPGDTEIYPTHGFGSFCSATPASGDSSTIADERQSNPALTQDEQSYVDELLAGLSDYPSYYAHMGVINEAGPSPVDLSLPRPVDPAELRRRIEAGEWVVDLRNRIAFAAGHLPGSFGFELSDSFVTYLGWLHSWGSALTLMSDDIDQIAAARRELVRIGIDELAGAAVGEIATLAEGDRLRSYRVADFTALAAILDRRGLTVVDVRQCGEYRDGHLPDAVNIPLHELSRRTGEVPAGEVWVHCATGYRSSIAASMIDQPDREVVLVDDDFEQAEKLGLVTAAS